MSIRNLIENNEKFPIKIFKYLPLPDENNHQMQLKNNDGVWNRYQYQNGTIDLFGFALDLEWTNFPLRGAYIPFWHTLIYSNVSSKINNSFETGNQWIVHLPFSQIGKNQMYHTTPDDNTYIVDAGNDNVISTKILKTIGFHKITSGGDVISESSVNIPKTELISAMKSKDEVSNYFNGNVVTTRQNEEFSTLIQSAKLGIELWRWFLVGLCILTVIEIILSNLKRFKNG